MMCVAIRLVESGWEVEIHDERDRPGGAWSTVDAFGHQNIEPAVHLLENRPAVYRHLEGSLGVRLEPEFGQTGRVGGRCVGFHATRSIMFAAVGLKAMCRGDADRATIAGRSLLRSLRHLPTPFAYPKGGSSQLVASLETRMKLLGIRLRLNSRVDCCRVNPTKSRVECETGEGTRHFDRIYYSSRSHPRFRVDDEDVELHASRTEVRSILLQLATSRSIDFGYVELIGDRDLARIRNVGRFAQPSLSPDRAILALQVRASSPRLNASDQEVGRRCEQLLRDRRLLCADDAILGIRDVRYAHHTIPDRRIKLLNRRLGTSAVGITTTDFAEDLTNIIERPETFWRPESPA